MAAASSSSDLYRGIAIGALAGAGAYVCLSRLATGVSSTKDDQDLSTTSNEHTGNVYETDRAVAEYLQFHFGRDKDLMPYDDGPREALAFASRTADLCLRWVDKMQLPKDAAFDVGCAVGRTSFDLSKNFKSVVGLDFSHKFIATADKLKSGASIDYVTTTEGEGRATYTCSAPKDARPERITFMQGDACNLPTGIGPFSVIQGSNLLCRLPDPVKFLESLPGILVPGGLVVLVSPYSWLKQYTPRDKWLGGFTGDDGVVKDSFTGLKEVMERLGFKLVHRENTQFLIREHVRKFQLGVSDATVWQLQ